MYGFVSTSEDRNVARCFMNQGILQKDQFRVLYEIYWDYPYDYYVLNNGMFPEEKEVLLNDGTTYQIDAIIQNKKENYYYIKIKHFVKE